MKKVLPAITLLTMAAITLPAHAVRLGANVGYTSGNYEEDDTNSDLDADTLDVGFVLDTAKPNRVFGYRLNVNYVDGEIDDDVDVSGLYVNNTFGFRISETSSYRFWVGPTVAVYAVEIDSDLGDADGYGFGLGGAVGVDLVLDAPVDVGFELGLRGIDFVLDSDDDEEFFDDDDIEYDGTEFYLKANLFFK